MQFGSGIFVFLTLLLPLFVVGGQIPLEDDIFQPCMNETTIVGNQKYTWTYLNETQGISEPPCLSKNNVIIKRQCDTNSGQWEAKPFYCKQIDRICPEAAIEIKYDSKTRCLKISNEPVTWSDDLCFGSEAYIKNIKSFAYETVINALHLRNIVIFWVPNSNMSHCLSGKKINQKVIYEMIPCNESHHSLCISNPSDDESQLLEKKTGNPKHQSFELEKINKEKEYTYAILFGISCDKETCQNGHFNKEKLGKLAEDIIQKTINHYQKFQDLRINRLKAIKSFKKNTVLCHVSASLKKKTESEIGKEFTAMKIRDYLKELLTLPNFTSDSWVNSTEFCFSEHISNSSKNMWSTVIVGGTSTTKELCLQSNGLPLARRCVGDDLYGAMFEKFEFDSKNIILPENITKNLFEIDSSKQAKELPMKTMKDVQKIVRKSYKKLIPADIYYVGNIVETVATEITSMKSTADNSNSKETIQNITKYMISDITSIFSKLMDVNVQVIEESASRNSTNMLLDGFERLIDEVSTITLIDSSNDVEEKFDDENKITNRVYSNGVFAVIALNVNTFVIDPKMANITGMAFYKSKDSKGNNNYRFLYSNQSVEALLEEDDLKVAAFVPETLLNRLSGMKNFSSRITINIFKNDTLFKENERTNKKVYGDIISFSIPGHQGNLPERLPLIMEKHLDDYESELICRYWDYKTWSKDGIVLRTTSKKNPNLVCCDTLHLTSYGILVGQKLIPESFHNLPLHIITLVGCCLSLFGTIAIFITALKFRNWRQKQGNAILLQLSVDIALQMVFICFVNTEDNTLHVINQPIWKCVALGAVLQYLVLVQFSWMMISAYRMYNKFVNLLNALENYSFLVKCFFITWIVPLVPVLFEIWYDPHSYKPPKNSGSPICYPTENFLYYGICLPLAVVVFCNLIIYTKIIFILLSERKIFLGFHNKIDEKPELRIIVCMFFTFGLSWIFGLLTAMDIGIVFTYLFCITATIQGFVLFIYSLILDPFPRNLWMTYFICISFKSTRNKKKDYSIVKKK